MCRASVRQSEPQDRTQLWGPLRAGGCRDGPGSGGERSKWQARGLGSPAARASGGLPGEPSVYGREQRGTSSVPVTSDCLLAPISLLSWPWVPPWLSPPWSDVYSSTCLETGPCQPMCLHSAHPHPSLGRPERFIPNQAGFPLSQEHKGGRLPSCFA